jgi:hypothetical protein
MRISAQREIFGDQRCLMQIAISAQPQEAILRSIELLGTVVAPTEWAMPAERKASA